VSAVACNQGDLEALIKNHLREKRELEQLISVLKKVRPGSLCAFSVAAKVFSLAS
jgi:transcription termination factor NusB